MHQARLLIALATAVAFWLGTLMPSSAQAGIPDGVFVRDANGTPWLVLGGKRVQTPIWSASGDDVAAIPESDQWAVMNDDGAIVAGARPGWVSADFGPFVGRWDRRDFGLVVTDSGSTLARWKVGACQSPQQATPCDHGPQQWGGRAEIVLRYSTTATRQTAVGDVRLSNGDLFTSGAVTLLLVDRDLVAVQRPGQQDILVCRPPRDPNTCLSQ